MQDRGHSMDGWQGGACLAGQGVRLQWAAGTELRAACIQPATEVCILYPDDLEYWLVRPVQFWPLTLHPPALFLCPPPKQGDCTSNDTYFDYPGTVRCLMEGAGARAASGLLLSQHTAPSSLAWDCDVALWHCWAAHSCPQLSTGCRVAHRPALRLNKCTPPANALRRR